MKEERLSGKYSLKAGAMEEELCLCACVCVCGKGGLLNKHNEKRRRRAIKWFNFPWCGKGKKGQRAETENIPNKNGEKSDLAYQFVCKRICESVHVRKRDGIEFRLSICECGFPVSVCVCVE